MSFALKIISAIRNKIPKETPFMESLFEIALKPFAHACNPF